MKFIKNLLAKLKLIYNNPNCSHCGAKRMPHGFYNELECPHGCAFKQVTFKEVDNLSQS
jgi:hypothetical protein